MSVSLGKWMHAMCLLLLSLTAVAQGASLLQQPSTGSISGTVLWIDGAPSAGATVTAISTSTDGLEKTGWVMGKAAAATTVTDGNGNYHFENLAPGLYHLVTGPVYLPRTFSDVSMQSAGLHLVNVTAERASTGINFTCVRDGEKVVYDPKQLVTVTGKLVLASIASPYGIHLDVLNSDGTVSRFQFRGPENVGRNFYWWPGYDAAPGGMIDKMSKAGEYVTVSGYDSGYTSTGRNPGLHILTVSEVTRGGVPKP
jgi:carboxypeptidase family protein